MRRTKPKTDGIDLKALEQRPDAADIVLVDPPSEGDDKAKAGTKAGYVSQMNFDRYQPTGPAPILNGIQYEAAKKLYRAHRRSMDGNPEFTGVYVEGGSGAQYTDFQAEGAIEKIKALRAIVGHNERHVVVRVVCDDWSLKQVRQGWKCGHIKATFMLCSGLDQLAQHYGMLK